MKLITRNTDYAIRAICSLASKQGQVVTVTELVKELKMPRPFLRKILQTLSSEGIIVSYKGSGGGFKMVMHPENITLANIVEAFQGPLSINECIFKNKICPNIRKCFLKTKIDLIEDRVRDDLRSTTIGSLLEKGI